MPPLTLPLICAWLWISTPGRGVVRAGRGDPEPVALHVAVPGGPHHEVVPTGLRRA